MPTTPYDLTIQAALHPNTRVRQVGFDLDHPYVERVWATVVGPTSVLMLRRMPGLWRDAEPAHVDPGELAQSLGLGGAISPNQRFWKTVHRLTQFGLARYGEDGSLDVFTKVAPLSARQLTRVPEWSRREHHRLLDEHIEQLAAGGTPNGTGPAADITARLDRLEQPRSVDLPALGR